MYMCLCRAVREEDVRRLGREGKTRAKELAQAFGFDREECCGRCLRTIQAFVQTAKHAAEESVASGKGGA